MFRCTLLVDEYIMKIPVKFVSQLRTLAGVEEAVVKLPEAATVSDLFDSLHKLYPDIFPLVRHAMVMVNHEIVTPEAVLHDGDEVMLLQLLGGG